MIAVTALGLSGHEGLPEVLYCSGRGGLVIITGFLCGQGGTAHRDKHSFTNTHVTVNMRVKLPHGPD